MLTDSVELYSRKSNDRTNANDITPNGKSTARVNREIARALSFDPLPVLKSGYSTKKRETAGQEGGQSV